MLKDPINKGIPTNLGLYLLKSTIVEQCCDNPEKLNKILHDACIDIMDEFYIKSNFTFMLSIQDILTLTFDKDNITKKIAICSYETLIATLNFYLGLNMNLKISKSNAREEVFKKLEELKRIRMEKDLKEKFPKIYDCYRILFECKEKINMYNKIKKFVQNTNSRKYDELIEEIKFSKDLLKKEGFESKNISVSEFSKIKSKMFKDIFNNNYFDLLEEICYKHSLYCSELEGINEDKLELYIASLSVICAKDSDKNRQKYSYYIAQYLKENKDDDKEENSIVITRHEDNTDYKTSYTIKKVRELYRQLLIENPDIKSITLDTDIFDGMTVEEVAEYMKEYLEDYVISWDILSTDDDSIDVEVVRKIRNSYKNLDEEEREQKIKKAEELYLSKKMFFDSLKPIKRIRGKENFNGYIGYIFENGKVVFEKFFKNVNSGNIAVDEAIYIMNVEDFNTLTTKTKKELLNNKDIYNFVRIYHSKNWQEKVIEYLSHNDVSNTNLEDQKVLKKES